MHDPSTQSSTRPSIQRLLIANRGAIAVRIIRTLKTMGITAIAVYAEADRDSLHVSLADEAWPLGEGTAADTYLNQDKLFDIIRQSKADAVHPGYGFLSENPAFVERCESVDIIFIGPTADQMRAFGLKHRARSLAQENHIPLLPGTELLTDLDEAIDAAETIGYPIILKSTAGGGGIGMQVCGNTEALKNAFDSVKRLSANNFSNDGVFIEKYIEQARHIEVQVFGNGQGQAVALGERDCSAQRRHQKVVEETPAPNLADTVRQQLHATAVRLVEAIHYRNAGTVEFIVDSRDQSFYFLEVNTRLQVEHGVTEQVYGVDLVQWMVLQATGALGDIKTLAAGLSPAGHAIQARLYAENPHKNFQPSAGLLSEVQFPEVRASETDASGQLRIDHWLCAGLAVSPYFDPMLAKIIVTADDRDSAIAALGQALDNTRLQGIETNVDYVRKVLATEVFQQGAIHTRYLNDFSYTPASIDVIKPGTMTSIQDYPGRVGYWDVGLPPSGPFDNLSFRLGNRLLGNPDDAAGLEITMSGPTLVFNCATTFVITGADIDAQLDETTVENWTVMHAHAGQTLKLGQVTGAGARACLLVAGGLDGHCYLGSRATFTLGQFGGFSGRALRTGDVLHLADPDYAFHGNTGSNDKPPAQTPTIDSQWQLRVIYGPHGAPDFFTQDDIEKFFSADWEVHYNSSRTGIRLMGPKPQWARPSGGEAGMHPSNIHDNAYAIGSVDFTGDMPVILGPDGPSLGGFVCPATVISADLWKLGQLKAGDKIRFVAVDQDSATTLEQQQQRFLEDPFNNPLEAPAKQNLLTSLFTSDASPVYHRISDEQLPVQVVYRPAGDKYLLVEYGPLELDLSLRFYAHALMLWLQQQNIPGVLELTPGIRSLQIHYDNQTISLPALVDRLASAEVTLQQQESLEVPSRIVHLPLSWDDEACHRAVEKYTQSVRRDAPWCPDNIEFIRRINGLESIQQVKDILFGASYVVMGLGDVYLGAPVATPLDPRHRLVTTKYNPARTWTAENSVGIGGSYLCVYGMEGPGGYQFVGRTLQMWNRYRQTREFTRPWLLRFFDQIHFYEVSAEELLQIREDFPRGDYSLKIEQSHFNLRDYQQFLQKNQSDIDTFTEQRNRAFDEELERWVANGQLNFDSQQATQEPDHDTSLPPGCEAVESHIAGNLWQWRVSEGDQVEAGQVLCILESMKMEIDITAPESGRVDSILKQQGQQVNAGQRLLLLSVKAEK